LGASFLHATNLYLAKEIKEMILIIDILEKKDRWLQDSTSTTVLHQDEEEMNGLIGVCRVIVTDIGALVQTSGSLEDTTTIEVGDTTVEGEDLLVEGLCRMAVVEEGAALPAEEASETRVCVARQSKCQ